MHPADGPQQILWRRILEQVAQRAGFDGGKEFVVRGKAGKHQNTRAGPLGCDAKRRFDTVQDRHQQVHQNHIGLGFGSGRDGFVPISRFPHNLEAAGFREQGTNALAHNRVVVHNQHSNHKFTSTVSRVPSFSTLS